MKEFISEKQVVILKDLGFNERILIDYDSVTLGTYYKSGRVSDVQFDYQILITYHSAFKFLLGLTPSNSYRMCYNDTGEIYNPNSSTYDIFNDKNELFDKLVEIINYNKL